MKRFIPKVILFLISLLILFYVKPVYLLIDSKYKDIVIGHEIYISIKKSKEKSKAKKVIFGDSVGRQLFPNTQKNDTVNSLACNQAIAMVGQFLLLQNYLAAGNKIDKLFMIFTPFSFQNNLNQVFTFHYFMKPFYNDEYTRYFTQTVKEQICKIPFSYSIYEPYILTSNWAPQFVCNDSIDYTFISPISREYLKKIKQLSIEHTFEIVLIPPPTSSSKKEAVDKFNKTEIIGTGLEKEFENI